MARLKDFSDYLDERLAIVKDCAARLEKLQEKYETFFQEVSRVRETELAQLAALIALQRDQLPPGYREALDAASAAAEREFDARLAALERERTGQSAAAEATRKSAAGRDRALRQQNAKLDAEEEELKTRNEALLRRIGEYNATIRDLGRGFGFFANLFRMDRLRRERRALDQEQADVAARIARLRTEWALAGEERARQENEESAKWRELMAAAAQAAARGEFLTAARARIVSRSALEQVLFALKPELPAPAPDDPACPRCRVRNPSVANFCGTCAQRLQADRHDLAGSLGEIAELNQHFLRFSEGMAGCQQFLGLVRGLASGLENFKKSVVKMMSTEHCHPLPKLQIDVPAAALAQGRKFDELKTYLERDLSLHPADFAQAAKSLTAEVFTASWLKTYFETMGQELSRQAKAQWKG